MPKGYTGPIDLSTARASEQTTVRQGADLTEYEKLLRDSWNGKKDANGPGAVMEIPIPQEARKTVESRLRQAAKEIGLGVGTGEKQDTAGELRPGFMWLLVQARTRKAAPTTGAKKATGATKKGLPPVAGAA